MTDRCGADLVRFLAHGEYLSVRQIHRDKGFVGPRTQKRLGRLTAQHTTGVAVTLNSGHLWIRLSSHTVSGIGDGENRLLSRFTWSAALSQNSQNGRRGSVDDRGSDIEQVLWIVPRLDAESLPGKESNGPPGSTAAIHTPSANRAWRASAGLSTWYRAARTFSATGSALLLRRRSIKALCLGGLTLGLNVAKIQGLSGCYAKPFAKIRMSLALDQQVVIPSR